MYILVGFEVLTVTSMKMAVFWVVAPCSLVEVYQRFSGTCCFHHQGPDDGDYTVQQPTNTAIFNICICFV
jgi:hypothetical protein